MAGQTHKLTSSIIVNNSQLYGLVTLRVLIGWHILYEGVSKLINPYWSSAAYLLDSKWIFSDLAKTIVSNPTL
jgi:thiosulfate dehydrogenase [quinone] large subunit